MPNNALRSALMAAALSLPAVAHAATIDDFRVTGDGHTFTYSLPASATFPDFPHSGYFTEAALTSIDGIAAVETSTYYDTDRYRFASIIFASPFVGAQLVGPVFINFVDVPASYPDQYHTYDLVATFIPGTYLLNSYYSGGPSYTFTITPESTIGVTPEPSTIVLLGTGALMFGLFGCKALRYRSHIAGDGQIRSV